LTLALVILVWPVFFVALWSLIMFSTSALSGWRRLATRYRATEPPPGGRVIGNVSGMIGWATYNRVLNVTVADNGLVIALPRIFRLAHPPLFIAWRDIHHARRTRKFFTQYVAFDIGDPKVAGMRLSPKVFDGTPVFID
jgi:hypothetical protein